MAKITSVKSPVTTAKAGGGKADAKKIVSRPAGLPKTSS